VSSMRVFHGLSAGKMEHPPTTGTGPPTVTLASLPLESVPADASPFESSPAAPLDPELLLPHATTHAAPTNHIARMNPLPVTAVA
jgi:hypothetical protein